MISLELCIIINLIQIYAKDHFIYSYTCLFFLCFLFHVKKIRPLTNPSSSVPAGKSSVICSYSGAASGTFTSDLSLSSCIKSSGLINVSGGWSSGTSVSTALLVLPLNISVGAHNQGSDGSADGIVFSLSINNGTQAWAIGGATATGFTVNVTRSDATGIEGTFSGQLGSDSDNSVVTLTNASFKGTY